MNRLVFRSRSPFGHRPPAGATPDGSVGHEVGVVCIVGGTPVIARGRVVGADGAVLHLALAGERCLPVRARAILEHPGRDGATARDIVTIVASSPAALSVRRVDARPPDRREYPRLRGTVLLRYRTCDVDERDGWLRGDAGGGVFRTPCPSMDFSATGLAFEDAPVARPGDQVLMELALPDEARAWRCAGTVVRVAPTGSPTRAGDEATHEIAVRIDAIPREATMALTRYTLRVQEASIDALFAGYDAH